MNTWAYLILIAALLFLAAAMLYARFASRSSEKSLHHFPMELMFPSETISAAGLVENETGRVKLSRGGTKGRPEIRFDRVVPLSGDGGEGESKKGESEYFDELQEAAAGLAMLMRSSPVARTEPVVFAPADVEVEVEVEVGLEGDKSEAQAEAEMVSEEKTTVAAEVAEVAGLQSDGGPTVSPMDEEVATEIEEVACLERVAEGPESVVDETTIDAEFERASEEDECEIGLPNEVRVLTTREILGDEVSERMDRIDEELGLLESLVREIESSLLDLDTLDLIEGEEDLGDTTQVFVPAAA